MYLPAYSFCIDLTCNPCRVQSTGRGGGVKEGSNFKIFLGGMLPDPLDTVAYGHSLFVHIPNSSFPQDINPRWNPACHVYTMDYHIIATAYSYEVCILYVTYGYN